ncbi:metallophosphoesterase [Microvirga sp. SRT01]|uniref:Metallophosphoesterase n=1 Tax=Sphingomonas longa TaxID=2778730 RepID=A0ABS2D938_9SPHN|nr:MULTISPECIES: LamG-like jellyroll fold domain-containing protein [Alphaproteobacteria]MBM6577446.1 metallophosphoesterase [Sphingomonas sp. BT552]MBR7710491.1 metallophosphoesterase [Microvirga sp. SRT01]
MSVDNERLLRRVSDRRELLRSAASLSILPLGAGLLSACGEGGAGAAADTAITTQGAVRSSTATTSFTIAVLPDTQFYSRYATTDESEQFQRKYGSTPFAAQTKWIADNAAAYNIPFVIHLGDVVDQVGKPNQWRIADAAMKQLEAARIPYSILAGNHDVVTDYEYRGPWDQSSGTDAQRNLGAEPYLQWFPKSRAATQATFRERDSSGFHEAHVFKAHGVEFMVLSLSWRISDAAIAWARDVIRRNPTLPVILSNHQLLNIDKDGVSPLETEYGKMLWEKLIRDTDQIFMTLNGHHHGAAWLSKTNDFGNQVEEMVVDYQMDYQGGNALMRLYEIDFTANRINVMSFSPWVVQKPKATLNQFDRAVLTEANNQFTIPINFKKRFAGFQKFRPTLATTGAPILPVVKANLLKDYTDPVPPVMTPPRDANDFPVVPDTYAHWRATGGKAGQAVAIGETLADISGNGFDMTRNPLTGPAQVGDVIWTDDKHYLSSAPGSLRFLNSDKVTGRCSSFATAPGMGVNNRSFWDGYTVEAFIKVDANWTRENHRWCNILARMGNRGNLPGFSGGDREASSVLFAISSLREVQWEIVPASNSSQPKANWSGEIMANTWYHVAIVNDPATRDTILYVEGAPVLRNVNGTTGIRSQNVNQPWVIGATHWDGAMEDGYFGHIGELRLVGRALTPDQWLTARRK